MRADWKLSSIRVQKQSGRKLHDLSYLPVDDGGTDCPLLGAAIQLSSRRDGRIIALQSLPLLPSDIFCGSSCSVVWHLQRSLQRDYNAEGG